VIDVNRIALELYDGAALVGCTIAAFDTTFKGDGDDSCVVFGDFAICVDECSLICIDKKIQIPITTNRRHIIMIS